MSKRKLDSIRKSPVQPLDGEREEDKERAREREGKQKIVYPLKPVALTRGHCTLSTRNGPELRESE
jgi:hypothetical protein